MAILSKAFKPDNFQLHNSSAAGGEFFERVQVGIDVYIPYRKY